MEYLLALPALILALVGLIGLRKEQERKDKTITEYIKEKNTRQNYHHHKL